LLEELEDQFGSLKDENTLMKERVRKLKFIHNGLTAQQEGKSAGVSTGMSKTAGASGFKKPQRPSSSFHSKK